MSDLESEGSVSIVGHDNRSYAGQIQHLKDNINILDKRDNDDEKEEYQEDDDDDGDDEQNLALLKIISTKENDYTILTKNERFALSMLLALVGLCSAMTMPIYWTALPEMAVAFNTTEEKINFTVTSYLCFQAVAPVFVSSLSDIFGRRPVILSCITGGIATNIGLAVSRKYWLIVFLRCVLAICVAPLISMNSACVGDFTTRRNRGGLTGLTSGFTLIGQGIAPFLGAVMDTAWGWPAIFWFSAALEGMVLVVAFCMLPETHRGFVGDLGVMPKKWIHRSPILYFYFKDRIGDYNPDLLDKKLYKYQPWKPPLLVVKDKGAFYILLPSSILFAIWTISQTSLSVHLTGDYNYSTLHVGLCFFAPGMATIVGTLTSGRILDMIYKKKKAKYDVKWKNEIEHGLTDTSTIPPFNIIFVRLYSYPFAAIIVCMAAIVFGWCLQNIIHIAVILVMCFLITFCCMFPLNITTTVLVDMYPQMSGGAVAMNNLFRCGMAAIFVSCLTKMENSMSTGGTYTFMGVLGMLFTGMIVVLMKKSSAIVQKR